ncbi:MAG: D-Ala-D-Ala carboxypeptidase family metallohydrolase, partial [Oscillospiraceae bacterium]|nr:D-Ala-D-Ala carboxypeptidase family metallohydrolase [Oscillospiraceae bacterium]
MKKILNVLLVFVLVFTVSAGVLAAPNDADHDASEFECCYWHAYNDECLPAEGGYSDYYHYELARYRELPLFVPFSTTMRTYNRNNVNQSLYLFNGQQSSLFTVGMIRCRHTSGGTCPATFQFDSRLVDIMHHVRSHFGRAITITSGFRCPSHNTAVGGAANSNHRHGRAVDIQVAGVTPTQVVAFARTVGASADTYVGSTFAHLAVPVGAVTNFRPYAAAPPPPPTTYTVVFNANGGTGTTANQVISRNANVALRGNGFSRAGHTFM